MPSAISSSIRTTPSTLTRSFAACRLSRSSETSLKASAQREVPCSSTVLISRGWSTTGWAAAMHAEDRHPPRKEMMQGLQHEAVAAQRNDDFGILGREKTIAVAQLFERLLRGFGLGRDDGDPWGKPRRWRRGHPPVTLICRATAGRLWRRSMMKS